MINSKRKMSSRKSMVLKLKKKQLEELYAPERNKVFSGDEEFMNTLHPFEETGKNAGKKSSPIQKAIIYAIKLHGNSASEEEILDFVKEKWALILKYSDRKFTEEPTIRLIRLNCAVKKKARRLFLKDPINPCRWILNTFIRKKTSKKQKPIAYEYSKDTDEYESEYEYASPEEIEPNYIMPNDTFEYKLEEIIKKENRELKFDYLCIKMKEFEKMKGVFQNLAFDRRVRATLIALKSEDVVVFDEKKEVWIPKKIAEEKPINEDAPCENVKVPSSLTLDEFYRSVCSLQ